jgi:hypothetical protein
MRSPGLSRVPAKSQQKSDSITKDRTTYRSCKRFHQILSNSKIARCAPTDELLQFLRDAKRIETSARERLGFGFMTNGTLRCSILLFQLCRRFEGLEVGSSPESARESPTDLVRIGIRHGSSRVERFKSIPWEQMGQHVLI